MKFLRDVDAGWALLVVGSGIRNKDFRHGKTGVERGSKVGI